MYIIRDDELNYIKDIKQRDIIANILYILSSNDFDDKGKMLNEYLKHIKMEKI